VTNAATTAHRGERVEVELGHRHVLASRGHQLRGELGDHRIVRPSQNPLATAISATWIEPARVGAALKRSQGIPSALQLDAHAGDDRQSSAFTRT
jgi:hypothetical protein